MADLTVEFFQKTLGESTPAPSTTPPVDIQNPILDVVQDHLTVTEKVALNAPFTVEELGTAAKTMKKRKCPGPDGIHVELFQEMWDMGPQLTEIINQGIRQKRFPQDLTLGHIVLLPKKLD